MSTRAVKTGSRERGDVLTAISDGMVALVCLLRGGFSRVEQTLWEAGRGASVIQQRTDFQDLMRERFNAVIEGAPGRQVVGFMSGNQQNPDIMCEVFILAGTDLVDG